MQVHCPNFPARGYHHEILWLPSVGLCCLLGEFFELAVSLVNWIDWVMEDVGERVRRMLSAEASRNRTAEGCHGQTEEEATIDGLVMKYPLWSPLTVDGRTGKMEKWGPQSPRVCWRARTRSSEDRLASSQY
jgi:hypothetical protein